MFKPKSFATLSVLVFFLGLTTYSVSSLQRSTEHRVELRRPFRLVQIESEVSPDGVETTKRLRTHDVDTDGNWHSTVNSIDNNGSVEYSLRPDGLSASRNGQYLPLGQKAGSQELIEKTHTVEFYENHPALVGTDVIAGIKVYKLRVPLEQKGGWLEMANSPSTGPIPLRTILHKPDGSEHRIETVKIEFLDETRK